MRDKRRDECVINDDTSISELCETICVEIWY